MATANRTWPPATSGTPILPGSVSVFINQGAGVFAPRSAYLTGGNGTYAIATADLNHDGILDLVTPNCNHG